ncbi:MAG TPA: MHYT domain-containing protein [Lacunisphaera sp.]
MNPVLGYAMSCLGAFLGLRCVTRARACTGYARARWLVLAAIAIGATGIWAMHFIAMLGYTIQGQRILYNVPLTIASMLLAIAVVGIGLFIVGFGDGGPGRLIAGGVIIGIGVASMHYMGMAAMSMPDSMHYNSALFILSVVIAIVAGTAALWAGTRVRSIGATTGASLIMGVAVSGMHYTGMAAMHVQAHPMSGMADMSGSTATSFIVPLLGGISLLTFALTLIISLSPTEDEITADAVLQRRMETEFSGDLHVNPAPGGAFGGAPGGTSGGAFGGASGGAFGGTSGGTSGGAFGGASGGTSGGAFGGTSGAGGQHPHGTPGSGAHSAPDSVPRSSLVWSRQPRVGSDAGHRRHPRNPPGQ